MKVYLAGPDVFHPDALAIGATKKALCREHGLNAVFPLDELADLNALSDRDKGLAIAAKDLRLLRSCDMAVVNLTPYPQLTMDPGSAVELGVMAGLGRPVWGYTNTAEAVETRLASHMRHGWMAERFGLVDNLMIEGTILQAGGQVFRPAQSAPFEDLSTFRLCIREIARQLATA